MSRRVLLCGGDAVLTRMLEIELVRAGMAIAPSADEADCALVDLDVVSPTAMPPELPAVGYTRGRAAVPAGMTCLLRPLDIPALCAALARLDRHTAVDAAPTVLRLDDATRSVVYGRARITLMPGEYAVLRRLLEAEGETVSRAELLAALPSGGETGSNLAEVLVCALRRRIESAFGIRPIRTVRGVGYKLAYEQPVTAP